MLKCYCATNGINSLDRKELQIVSVSYKENLDENHFLFDINAGSIASANLTQNVGNTQNMYLNNLTEDKDNVFEEVPYIANIINVKSESLKEEEKVDIKEENLYEFIESDKNEGMAASTMNLGSIGRIQQTEITSNVSEILIHKTENMENICHSIQKSSSQLGMDTDDIIHTEDKNNVFEEVPYTANILNVKIESLNEDEIEIKEEKLCKFIESYENVAADTMNVESIGRIKQTEITSNDSEILINKTENICHSSEPGIDTEEIIHGSSDDICLKKRKCDECPYATMEEINIELHLNTHQSEKTILKCSECYYITTCSNSLKKHMETHKSKPKTFKCQKCDYATRKHSHLVSHILIHQENYNFKCDRCSYKARRKDSLIQHMLIHEDNYNFQCQKCSYQGKRKIDLVRHMLIHQDNYYFKCHKCSYQAKSKPHMVSHMLVHEENYNFKCEKCSYKAKRRTSLVSHMLIHQDICNFSCDKCSVQTKRKSDLVKHMLLHQENYNFKCQKCSYQTKTRQCLVRHMLIHQDNCDFSCYKCSYQTKRKTNLVKHMLIHQDICNFSCDKCSYQTKRKSDLAKHMLIHQTKTKCIEN